jgi:S1-C subfamily serine protease
MKLRSFDREVLTKAAVMLLVLASASAAPTSAQTSSGKKSSAASAAPAGSKYRVVSAVAGTTGVQRNGRFIIIDPRTIFHPSEDHTIVVKFEWEGPTGPHKFQGLWTEPSGKVRLVSELQFEALQKEFAGYWTMPLDEKLPTGTWTLNARIDDESAGSLSFEIAADAAKPPVKYENVSIAASAIYKKTAAAMVVVEKDDSDGKKISTASGFFVGPGRVLTSFGSIDGATTLGVYLSNGKRIGASNVLSWSRLQDWTVLEVSDEGMPALPFAPDTAWNVGESYYSIGHLTAGDRIVVQGTIIGRENEPSTGERMNLSTKFDADAVGSPLLNDFGDVIGMLSRRLTPGSNGVDSATGETSPTTAGSSVPDQLATAVPLSLVKIPAAGSAPATLADLMAKGEFIPLLREQDKVASGVLGLGLDRKKNPRAPRDVRDHFSHNDAQLIVFINWDRSASIPKGSATLKIYNLDNKQVGDAQAAAVNVHPKAILNNYWTVPLASFPAGMYRADVYFGDAPVWREYFRVLP